MKTARNWVWSRVLRSKGIPKSEKVLEGMLLLLEALVSLGPWTTRPHVSKSITSTAMIQLPSKSPWSKLENDTNNTVLYTQYFLDIDTRTSCPRTMWYQCLLKFTLSNKDFKTILLILYSNQVYGSGLILTRSRRYPPEKKNKRIRSSLIQQQWFSLYHCVNIFFL